MGMTTLPTYVRRHLTFSELAASRKVLQHVLEQGPVSQPETADALQMSRGTCHLHFQKLRHLGLIHTVDSRVKGRGRSTGIWTIRDNCNFFLTLIWDVPFFQAALLDFSGRDICVFREDWTQLRDQKAMQQELDVIVGKCLQAAKKEKGVIRHAAAFAPGLLDTSTGTVLKSVNFPLLDGFDIPGYLRETHGVNCHCGPLGAAFYHGEVEALEAGRRVMVVHWDLGIGAMAGTGDLPFSDRNDTLFPYEMGHARIAQRGPRCHCGKDGCLEAHVGGWAMIRQLDDPCVVTLDAFRSAVLQENKRAVQIAKQAAQALGENIYWMVYSLQCERLVISGPLSVIFPVVRSAFIKGLARHFTKEEIAALNPVASADPVTAMKRGAFRLARHRFFYQGE